MANVLFIKTRRLTKCFNSTDWIDHKKENWFDYLTTMGRTWSWNRLLTLILIDLVNFKFAERKKFQISSLRRPTFCLISPTLTIARVLLASSASKMWVFAKQKHLRASLTGTMFKYFELDSWNFSTCTLNSPISKLVCLKIEKIRRCRRQKDGNKLSNDVFQNN